MDHSLSASLSATLWSKLLATCQEARGLPEPGWSIEPMRALHRHPARFHPSAWLSLLPGLQMEPGWELDFVYHVDGNHGHPVLYARQTGAWRADAPEDLQHAGIRGDDWQRRVRLRVTPESCLQMVMLSLVAPRFHLIWHSQTGWTDLVFDPARLRDRLSSIPEPAATGFPPPGALDRPRESVLAAARPFYAPTVDLRDDGARVNVLTWVSPGGLSRRAYVVRPGHPVGMGEEIVLGRTLGGLPT